MNNTNKQRLMDTSNSLVVARGKGEGGEVDNGKAGQYVMMCVKTLCTQKCQEDNLK